jgi:hypothetical protein
MNLGKPGCVLQFAVDLVFVAELRTASTMLFEFHGHLQKKRINREKYNRSGDLVSNRSTEQKIRASVAARARDRLLRSYLLAIRSNSQINITEGPPTNSLGDSVFLQRAKSVRLVFHHGHFRYGHSYVANVPRSSSAWRRSIFLRFGCGLSTFPTDVTPKASISRAS